MSYAQRINLAMMASGLLVLAWYAHQILPLLSTTAPDEIAFARPMMVAIGIGIVLSIISAILVSVGSAIWTGVREGEAAVSDEMNEEDERDKQISRLGDAVGGNVLSVAVIAALMTIWFEHSLFVTAHILFLGAWASAIAGAVVKQVAYMRGV